jgi:DNA repair exonuclease SbcCD nuclease subunit
MTYTIVHCADVHLETTFPEVRGGNARRKALADAFVRVVDLALERGADALTIGGDLYEAERAGPQTARFLFEQFARFGKPVFIAPGNHDPHTSTALTARDDLPPNVRSFNESTWSAIPLAEGITLFGYGHTPAEPGRPFAGAHFERGGVQLALLHGSDQDRCPPNKRVTAAFTQAEVVAAGTTLLLTGHFHGGYVARGEERAVFAYPGSPEPIKFGERGAHGALVVTIDGTQVGIEAVPLARTRLLERSLDLAGAATEQAAFERVGALLADCGSSDYVRLGLTGEIAHGTRIDPALLAEHFGALLGALEISDDTVAYDYAAIAREPTVRGRVVADLLALRSQPDPERAEQAGRALRYALAAFEGAEIAP